MSPLAQKYLEDEPQAAALLLELAQFRRGSSDESVEGIAERLKTRRVATCSTWRARASRSGPAGRRRRSCRRRSASGGRRLRRWSVRASGVPHLSLAGAPVEAALVTTLAAPLQGPTPDACGRRRPWCCCRRARPRPARPDRARAAARGAASTPRSPECAGRWSRSSASPSSSRSAEGVRSARRPPRALRRRAPGRAAGARRRAARRAPTRSKRPCRAGTSNRAG
jgi:hypothetical protein